MITNKTPKNAKKFICESCNFKCSKQSDFDRHLSTAKHKMITDDNIKTPKTFECDCGKEYNFASGLSRHKKKCQYIEEEEEHENTIVPAQNEPSSTELLTIINKMMTENQELCKTIKEMVPRIGNTTNNTNNNNTTNNFNVNMYLNNECNNAISLQQFSHDLQITEAYIIHSSKDKNIVDNLAYMIIDSLAGMDITIRPIHCTDQHRGTLMIRNDKGWSNDKKRERDADTIKEDTTWKKTDTNDPILSNSIKQIAMVKIYKAICNYIANHSPNSKITDSHENKIANEALFNTNIDCTDEEELKTGSKKIFKKITPEIKLNKETATC